MDRLVKKILIFSLALGLVFGGNLALFNIDTAQAEVSRLYFRDTQTEAGTGGIVHDLSDVQGTPAATLDAQQNGFSEAVRFQMQISEAVSTSAFPVSVNIANQNGSTEIRLLVQRRASDGTLISASNPSASFNTAGVHTATLTLAETWAVGDIIAVSVEGNHSGGGGRAMDISVQHADSYIDVDFEEAAPPVDPPTVITATSTGITSNQATGNGEITDTGGENADERGFVWDTVSRANPGDVAPGSSVYASSTTDTGDFGAGTFFATLDNLSASTTYFYRAYAHNSAGYSYGNEVSFTTGAETTPASWLAEENQPYTTEKNTNVRLRIQIANEGNIADAAGFQLEYSNSTAGPWTPVPVDAGCSSTTEAFRVCFSDNFSNEAPTTQRLSTTGVEGFGFTSGHILHGSNPAPEIVFATSTFTEVEWNIQATASAADGGTYFFRVSNPGESIGNYSVFPQLNIAADDFLLNQNHYRWYEDNNSLTLTSSWNGLEEDAEITSNDSPPAPGNVLRLRMSFEVTGQELPTSTQAFTLEYGERETTCADISSWNVVGGIGSGSVWRGVATGPPDGTTLGTLLLSESDVAGTFERENDSSANPNIAFINDSVEYDWALQHNGANPDTDYCFRMVKVGGADLNNYSEYPALRTAPFAPETQNWQWYGDAASTTPAQPLDDENVAPFDIQFNNPIKLRITAAELFGVIGENVKFRLQYSESSTFSDGGTFIDEIGGCTSTSTWCYADGGGDDNAVIPSTLLSDSDTAGTHNESGTSASTFTHPANAAVEYEFTLVRAQAAAMNTVYFFRLYDTQADAPLAKEGSHEFPSLSTEGATLSFEIQGISQGTFTEGVTTTVSTSATSVDFQTLSFENDAKAAQRKVVTTNAANGYRIFVYQLQSLLNQKAEELPPVTTTNEIPGGWETACDLAILSGCYGYHAGDDILSSGTPERFAPEDSYARLEEEPKEIAFFGGPAENRTTDIVFRKEITPLQPPGRYATELIYIVVPVF